MSESLRDEAKPVANSHARTPILRAETPPADQRDYDDRHYTRATENDESAGRYAFVDRGHIRGEWQRLVMYLVGFVVMVVLYLAGFVVVLRSQPHLGPWVAAKIVGLAFVAAGGGAIVRSASWGFRRRDR
jgi:hypothetical protein